jgi:hypothetical protein
LRAGDAKNFCAAKLRRENLRRHARVFLHRRAMRMNTRFARDAKFARALSRDENGARDERLMKK